MQPRRPEAAPPVAGAAGCGDEKGNTPVPAGGGETVQASTVEAGGVWAKNRRVTGAEARQRPARVRCAGAGIAQHGDAPGNGRGGRPSDGRGNGPGRKTAGTGAAAGHGAGIPADPTVDGGARMRDNDRGMTTRDRQSDRFPDRRPDGVGDGPRGGARDDAGDGAGDDDRATIGRRLADIRRDIAAEARKAGRDPAAVTLVAVSKQQPDTRIDAALASGQRVFGENRVQEARARWEPRRRRHGDLELHLVGPLQTNKVKDAVGLFDAIQTLDRARLAEALAQLRDARPALDLPRLFIQVNTGEEPQKAGVFPADLAVLHDRARRDLGLPVDGLMCIPPRNDEPSLHFALLAKMARELGLAGLSMGMSDDYGVAVRLGATHVRVGTKVFGSRV